VGSFLHEERAPPKTRENGERRGYFYHCKRLIVWTSERIFFSVARGGEAPIKIGASNGAFAVGPQGTTRFQVASHLPDPKDGEFNERRKSGERPVLGRRRVKVVSRLRALGGVRALRGNTLAQQALREQKESERDSANHLPSEMVAAIFHAE